ncbi:MAG: toll/interleukin-1 receptor domain-containing protein [Eggerthellaceae bacterium]|nr:toll/interleukin-1 receptor domain-containing protein [Eggerthellaceae bacterium]
MRVFISWSGDLSHRVAKVLREWIPCIVQTVEVFLSSEDIEKGDKWEHVISSNLSDCSFAIVCLTKENLSAPWINFEAGAIAKALNGRIATVLVEVKPSELKGPLSSYQATSLDKEDFYRLIESVNSAVDGGLEPNRLRKSFDAMWGGIKSGIDGALKEALAPSKHATGDRRDVALEEILQLLRRQYSLVSSPERLLPREYLMSNLPTLVRPNAGEEPLATGLATYLSEVNQRAEICLEGSEGEVWVERMQEILRFDLLEERIVKLDRTEALFLVKMELRRLTRMLSRRDDSMNSGNHPGRIPYRNGKLNF